MMFYKVLNLDGSPCNGGDGKWHLPTKKRDGTWKPGKWMPVLTDLVPCKHGYHLCRENDLLQWLGPLICIAEGRGEQIVCDDKVVFAQARLLSIRKIWDERTARLFAADCAENVLPIWEKEYPDDLRPRKAIIAARAFVDGLITKEELARATSAVCAAWATNVARAVYATSAAAVEAASAAWAASAARATSAAWAARAARATSAAWAARAVWAARATSAAWAAEREWQTKRFMEYLVVQSASEGAD